MDQEFIINIWCCCTVLDLSSKSWSPHSLAVCPRNKIFPLYSTFQLVNCLLVQVGTFFDISRSFLLFHATPVVITGCNVWTKLPLERYQLVKIIF